MSRQLWRDELGWRVVFWSIDYYPMTFLASLAVAVYQLRPAVRPTS